jgi:hypothetical protein
MFLFDTEPARRYIATQLLPLYISTASFSVLSSSFVQLHLRAVASSLLESKTSTHLFQHCRFARPGTSAEIATQFLPLCFSTASFSVLSSSVVHLPLRAVVSSLLESKVLYHLFNHCVLFDPKPARKSSPLYFSTAPFSVLSSSVVHLSIRTVVSSLVDGLLLVSIRSFLAPRPWPA